MILTPRTRNGVLRRIVRKFREKPGYGELDGVVESEPLEEVGV